LLTLARSDVHIYYFQNNPDQSRFARELHTRIRLEFPELRIYTFWDQPIGPHPVAMFEVNLLEPAQFGAFVPWLAVHRGPLSVLVHPNTTEEDVERGIREERNHTERAIWMGERLPIDTSVFRRKKGAGPVKVG
jgi:aromatic ring-cleaving dioxygenase